MAVRDIGVWIIISYFVISTKVDADISCELEAREIIFCKAENSTYDVNILQRGLLPTNENTTSISLSSCEIVDIEIDVFDELSLVTHLDLSSNYLRDITVGTFDALTGLQELDLSDNSLEDIPVGLFIRNVNLQKLNLKNNVLQIRQSGMFNSLVSLTTLDLTDNIIQGKYLNSELFASNTNITTIRLSANNMSETPYDLLISSNRLVTLRLVNCQFIEFPSFVMVPNMISLSILNLRFNGIRRLDNDTFDNLINLSLLNLDSNKLEYIAEDSFRLMKNLIAISLKRNLLVTIPKKLFINTSKLFTLNLSHNMISVLPDNLFKRTNLKYLNLAYNRITYLQSDFCTQQKNTGALLKKFFFNHNPWQCACLRDLLWEVKQLKIKYNNTYFDGGQSVCSTTSEFVCKRQEDVTGFYADLFYGVKTSDGSTT